MPGCMQEENAQRKALQCVTRRFPCDFGDRDRSAALKTGSLGLLSLFFLPLEELLVDPVRFRFPLESP